MNDEIFLKKTMKNLTFRSFQVKFEMKIKMRFL